ncbi:RagB/SusD family nutrient uptake outer membrane protein [Pedobacter sp. KBW06]|uniref:RagB/SusD family nutrient uptake outer membrane protein n=1 Tax=Pedobacter sp. KBW06 TaxID=2153359 RepID=UPI000F592A06|nr:RagB/SusD family nutrient uptake outer membrane protein [Pedobacter sp. KBW06]RQO74463.1 RagB/SusD family nutrient uptake outer membrane protein [Pedobacter sp. KBW06]
MKRFKYLIIVAGLMAVTGLSSSCKKLIEIPSSPANRISTAEIVADSANVMGAIAGVYTGMGATLNTGFGFSTVLYTGLSSDELTAGQFIDPIAAQFLSNTVLSNNSFVRNLWADAYKNMYQINACMEIVNGSSAISAGLKKQLVAEIKVVRAFYYFNLINLYGEIPLVLATDFNLTAQLPRAGSEEIFKQIILDLTEAEQALVPAYPSALRARPNSYVAKALLAKIYLYRKDWVNAENMATQVISSASYQLPLELNNVFLEGSPEAIWQLPANGLSSQTAEGQRFVPFSNRNVPTFPVTSFLVNAFEVADLRKQKWLGLNRVDLNFNGVLTDYYYPNKYKNNRALSATTEAYMILRLAEQYLIRAEARARLNKLEVASEDLNKIRNRAGLGISPAEGQTAILAAIMKERQTELFCEWGNRWFDLKRTETIDQVLGAEKPGWRSTSRLFPIPADQIRLNPALIQNPGYN